MAKPVKSKWLGARVDSVMDGKVTAYIETAEITMGDLLREAVNEYMANHPIKTPRLDHTKPTKPGE